MMPKKEDHLRVKKLSALIRNHSYKYHVLDEPEIEIGEFVTARDVHHEIGLVAGRGDEGRGAHHQHDGKGHKIDLSLHQLKWRKTDFPLYKDFR